MKTTLISESLQGCIDLDKHISSLNCLTVCNIMHSYNSVILRLKMVYVLDFCSLAHMNVNVLETAT